MNNKPIAIEDYEGLCFKCLQKKPITTYSLYRSDYGSSFDNCYTYLQICDDCKPEGIDEWFDEEPETIEYCANYKFEKNILGFIDSLPIEGQELFWARCSHGACATYMEGQDWIDYKLGILPHEKCKEYGYYSPQEIEAYKTRFPICQHPVNKIYDDNSKGCWCPFGSHGEYGQKCGLNICSGCYKCKHFTERTTPIREISSEDYDEYVIYYTAKLNQEKYKNKFE
jgi:hypothetical protein